MIYIIKNQNKDPEKIKMVLDTDNSCRGNKICNAKK